MNGGRPNAVNGPRAECVQSPKMFSSGSMEGDKVRFTDNRVAALGLLIGKPHPAKPGPVFPQLQPKASKSLPSWTETQVSVTPSYLASESQVKFCDWCGCSADQGISQRIQKNRLRELDEGQTAATAVSMTRRTRCTVASTTTWKGSSPSSWLV
jgi:hypothetical protein